MSKLQLITKGILKENPTFVLVLGMCPTLGTTTNATNGLGMGVATMAVLIMSNIVISLIKNLIPEELEFDRLRAHSLRLCHDSPYSAAECIVYYLHLVSI